MLVNRGFTLIELLVVLLILSISTTFGLLAFGDFGQTRKVKISAEQLVYYLKLLQQQAVLTGKTYGIKIDKDSYQALFFENNRWHSMNNKPFKIQFLAKGIYISSKKTLNQPDITINPTGQMTNNDMLFSNRSQALYRLRIYNNTTRIETLAND